SFHSEREAHQHRPGESGAAPSIRRSIASPPLTGQSSVESVAFAQHAAQPPRAAPILIARTPPPAATAPPLPYAVSAPAAAPTGAMREQAARPETSAPDRLRTLGPAPIARQIARRLDRTSAAEFGPSAPGEPAATQARIPAGILGTAPMLLRSTILPAS